MPQWNWRLFHLLLQVRCNSFKTYHQIQEWLGNKLNPDDWSWSCQKVDTFPVGTILPIAPDEIIVLIFCSCKSGCSTLNCSYVKSGSLCSRVCKICEGLLLQLELGRMHGSYRHRWRRYQRVPRIWRKVWRRRICQILISSGKIKLYRKFHWCTYCTSTIWYFSFINIRQSYWKSVTCNYLKSSIVYLVWFLLTIRLTLFIILFV